MSDLDMGFFISSGLLANLQSVAGLSIAANLAYLNIQNLKYLVRARRLIRDRYETLKSLPDKSLTPEYQKNDIYYRLYHYGYLNEFDTDLSEPDDNVSYDHGGGVKSFFNIFFMFIIDRKFPLTIDKLLCAVTLTVSVVIFLSATFSNSIGQNVFFGSNIPSFTTFYLNYIFLIWGLPLILVLIGAGEMFWVARCSKRKENYQPKYIRTVRYPLLAAIGVAFLWYYSDIWNLVSNFDPITDNMLRTLIFLCGIFIFIPTYLVCFASIVFPGLERDLERDLNKLFIDK